MFSLHRSGEVWQLSTLQDEWLPGQPVESSVAEVVEQDTDVFRLAHNPVFTEPRNKGKDMLPDYRPLSYYGEQEKVYRAPRYLRRFFAQMND